MVTPSSSVGDRQSVFAAQAHEMAHQWNGDLVTMGWWDDLWLNESFASWRAAQETDQRHPDWLWWESLDSDKEDAMEADARQASKPIQQHVTVEMEARSAFDPQITYSKGEAVLRMLEAYVKPSQFRSGVRSYMRDHAFSNATTADLWLALDAASGGSTVSKVAAEWTEQPGYPLVTAAAHCDPSGHHTVTLSQKRFLLEGEDPAHHSLAGTDADTGGRDRDSSRPVASRRWPEADGGPMRRALESERGGHRLLPRPL